MTEPRIFPQVGETWQLISMPANDADWVNVLILEVIDDTDGTKIFVSAKIIVTELPVNYSGLNVEINDGGFSSGICSPFVVYLDEPRHFDIRYFQQKRGKLKNEDWKNVVNNYLKYKKTVEFKHGKKN